jgi:hypothetical protein
VLGGQPLPWNYFTQTREKKLEWLSAQNYIENLPERELQQEEAWGRVVQESRAGESRRSILLVWKRSITFVSALFSESQLPIEIY